MLRSALLSPAVHAFTGLAEGDLRRGNTEGLASLAAVLGGRSPIATVSQVHGNRVLAAEDLREDTALEADALFTTTPGTIVAVRVADCVPVLLAGPGVVAAVHAGWRGTAADIVRLSAAAAATAAGCRVHELRAAVGPSIRGCCYEVGDEVIQGVGAVAPGASWRDGRHVDLAEANRAILAEIGVAVEVVGGCTRCGEGWFSHRRGDLGRQVGAIRA
ncbi:laccase domain protein [Deltaproteobacteria bacterium]|nr:laccase domain protein [Deltaproteobacteria bacterium]